jgi:hypothetical protein
MIGQLCSLERRTARGGKDSIDHPPGNHHDDIINSAAGSLTNLIIEDWNGGKAVLEVARRQMAAEKAAGTWPFAKNDKPQPITREWARGSVEWVREQAGETVPHPPREAGGTSTAARTTDEEEIRELFSSTLKP